MEPKIISQTAITTAELKEEIGKIKNRQQEPSIRVTKIEDYLNAFPILTPAKAKKLAEELKKLDIPRLKEEHIAKIIDILPTTPEDVKLLMQGYVISLSNESLKKIADTVAQNSAASK